MSAWESPIVGASPENAIDTEFSAICSIGRPPLVMTGALLWLLRRHFSNADNITDDGLKDNIWAPAATESGLMIESATRWSGPPTQTTQMRPALLVKRNTYGRYTVGIGDRYQGQYSTVDTERLPGNNASDNSDRFEVGIAGSHTVFCIGTAGAEAETLAAEVFFELLEFGPLIRRDLGLWKFRVMEMQGLGKLEESKEHWVVPVVVTYAFNHGWRLRQLALPLKTISLESV